MRDEMDTNRRKRFRQTARKKPHSRLPCGNEIKNKNNIVDNLLNSLCTAPSYVEWPSLLLLLLVFVVFSSRSRLSCEHFHFSSLHSFESKLLFVSPQFFTIFFCIARKPILDSIGQSRRLTNGPRANHQPNKLAMENNPRHDTSTRHKQLVQMCREKNETNCRREENSNENRCVCVCCSEFKVFGLGFNPQESLVVWNSISCSESDSDTGFGSRAMQNAHGNVMKKRYIST